MVTLMLPKLLLSYLYCEKKKKIKSLISVANQYADPYLMATFELFIFEKAEEKLMADNIDQENLARYH